MLIGVFGPFSDNFRLFSGHGRLVSNRFRTVLHGFESFFSFFGIVVVVATSFSSSPSVRSHKRVRVALRAPPPPPLAATSGEPHAPSEEARIVPHRVPIG